MALDDYLLQADACDWGAGLSEWLWLIPGRVKIWFANRFGEPFLLMEDGSIHLLRLDDGELIHLVDGEEEFHWVARQEGVAEDWLRMAEVDARVASGAALGPGECHGFLVPRALGGYDTGHNLVVMDIVERIAALGRVHRRIRDLSGDGATSAAD